MGRGEGGEGRVEGREEGGGGWRREGGGEKGEQVYTLRSSFHQNFEETKGPRFFFSVSEKMC